MYFVNKHLQTLNYFCHVNDVFSKEEVEKIIDLEDIEKFKKGLVGSNNPQDKEGYHSDVRETDVMWINYSEHSHWLYQKFGDLVSQINHDHFLYNITGFDSFQYGVYTKDAHYDWHIDQYNISTNLVRKISASVLLSDPDSYQGGELNFILNGQVNNPYITKPNMGDVVFFASWIPHKVSPVISGTRKSLVCWVMGER